MTRRIIMLGLAWVGLLALGGGEYLVSTVHMPLADRPVILVLAVAMLVVVAFAFMNLARAPLIVKGFAVAAMFWLIVLFGLGTMDALTRNMWWVQHYSPK